MNAKLKIKLALVLSLAASSTIASATIITFDDLSDGSVPNGYAGFNWDNFDVLAASGLPAHSGYQNGLISSPNVAYNAFGNPASWMSSASTFTLNSAYVTAAWSDDLNVEVQGWNGGTELYDQSYTVNTERPSLLAFNFVGVTFAEFITSGGVDQGLGGAGTQIALDNVAVNEAVTPVPEPSTIISGALLLLPFGSSSIRRLGQKMRAP